MVKNVRPYYIIVDLFNLCFIDKEKQNVEFQDAEKFYEFKDAETFLREQDKEFKNRCAIYKVESQVTLQKIIDGQQVNGTLFYGNGVRGQN